MSQSLSQIIVHGVFSTKHRTPWLDKELRKSLFAYIATILKSKGHVPILIGGHDDHIHMLFGLARTESIADTIKHTKVNSSVWIKEEFENLQDFAWQGGYGAFSVSYQSIGSAMAYISNQDEHHKKMSFQDEFRQLMAEHGIAIDERYVWD
jgi:REP element-mobilizing transposase RayT